MTGWLPRSGSDHRSFQSLPPPSFDHGWSELGMKAAGILILKQPEKREARKS